LLVARSSRALVPSSLSRSTHHTINQAASEKRSSLAARSTNNPSTRLSEVTALGITYRHGATGLAVAAEPASDCGSADIQPGINTAEPGEARRDLLAQDEGKADRVVHAVADRQVEI